MREGLERCTMCKISETNILFTIIIYFISVEQLKKKWKNLKDAYRKELKKNPDSRSGDPGCDNDTSSQWKYFNMMTFLKEEFMPAENESNLNEDLDDSTRFEIQLRQTPSPSSPLQPREVSAEPCATQLETPQFSRKRSKPNDIRAEYLEIEKKKLKILEQEVARQSTSNVEKTDDYYYLMSLLPEMQKLSPIKKMRVRNRINQVLMDEMVMNMYGDTTHASRSRGHYTQPPPVTNHFNDGENLNLYQL